MIYILYSTLTHFGNMTNRLNYTKKHIESKINIEGFFFIFGYFLKLDSLY